MQNLPIAQTIQRRPGTTGAALVCTLDYAGRFLRRKRLRTDCGVPFLVDLAQAASLDEGDVLELSDGRLVAIAAAAEDLLQVQGDLPRLAWHIGNRHTPCQIDGDRLLIGRDPVIAHMLEHLGASVLEVYEPFTPEGGAYGHGRTHGHEHGASAHTGGEHGQAHAH